MTNYSNLIERVRSPFALTEQDAQEIADALEAQAKEIAELKAMHQRDIDCIKRASIRIAELEAASKAYADVRKPAPR